MLSADFLLFFVVLFILFIVAENLLNILQMQSKSQNLTR